MVDGSLRCLSTSALDVTCTKQAKAIRFASIMTIGNEASPKGKKCHGKGKGKRRAGVAMASMGMGIQIYTPVKLLSSGEAYLKVMVVHLEAANAVLSSTYMQTLCSFWQPYWPSSKPR